MGRKLMGSEERKGRGIRVEDSLWDAVTAAALRRGISRNEFIVRALRRVVEGERTRGET